MTFGAACALATPFLSTCSIAQNAISLRGDWITPIVAVANNAPDKPAAPSHEDATRITYTVTLLSDYMRAGTSRTDGKPALQGAIDARMPDGWNFGARGSNVAKHGNAEVAFYGSKNLELGDASLTLGATIVTYPHDPNGNFVLLQTSVTRAIGPIDATASILYAPPQANLDDEDNFYAVVRARTPVGSVLGVPVTLGASIGRMRGHFADAHSRSDWSVGFTGHFEAFDVGITYVDNDLGDSRGDPTTVFSITRSF
jgi:uncharacterized protein (TIGR02001 family)